MTAVADRFALPPLAVQLADADEFDAWMGRAVVGDVFLLARGRVRPTHAPVWLAASMAQRAGVLVIVARATGDAASPTLWQAEWTGARGAGGDARVALRRADGGAERREPTCSDGELVGDRILRLLRRSAGLGTPCPSQGQLARECELNSAAAAKYWIEQLAARKLIRIEKQPDPLRGERRRYIIIDPRGADKVTPWSDYQPTARKGAGHE
jgi:hypothetical protein